MEASAGGGAAATVGGGWRSDGERGYRSATHHPRCILMSVERPGSRGIFSLDGWGPPPGGAPGALYLSR